MVCRKLGVEPSQKVKPSVDCFLAKKMMSVCMACGPHRVVRVRTGYPDHLDYEGQ